MFSLVACVRSFAGKQMLYTQGCIEMHARILLDVTVYFILFYRWPFCKCIVQTYFLFLIVNSAKTIKFTKINKNFISNENLCMQ